MAFDFGQEEGGPRVSSDKLLMVNLNGTFFDKVTGTGPKDKPASFKVVNNQGHLQGYLSEYTLNSVSDSEAMVGQEVDFTALITKYLKYTVTCGHLGKLIPELAEKYGDDTPVTIKGLFFDDSSNIKIVEGKVTLTVSAQVILEVNGEKALTVQVHGATGEASGQGNSGTIFGSIDKNFIGEFGDFETTLGIDQDTFYTRAQDRLDGDVNVANQALAAGITIPTIGGIDFSGSHFSFQQGYVEGGVVASKALFDTIFVDS